MSVKWPDFDADDRDDTRKWWRGEEPEDTECPTCGRNDFKDNSGMKRHHANVHGESLAQVELDCAICGGRFEVHKSKSDERKCCSYDCAAEYRSRYMTGEDNPAWKGGEVTLECEYCGEGYEKVRALVERSRFCSKECQSEWRSENLVGENHWSWLGGYVEEYGDGWNKEKKERVRERDGYECQDPRCDTTQEEHLEEYGRKLYVHHIIPAREFDDSEKRNDESNLVSLCANCHPKWEAMSPLRPVPTSE